MEHANSGEAIIVLAVDCSVHSEFAFNYYVTEVHRPNYVLHLIHCSEAWAQIHSEDGGHNAEHVKSVQQKEEAKVKQLEEKYTKLMKENNVKGEFKVVGGKDAWHGVIDYQEKTGAIMIVVGTRGSNAIRRTLMGSVSDSIVHHAHCPVLVCRHS